MSISQATIIRRSRSNYLKEWRKRNPDKVRQHKRNYRVKHREHINKHQREKYHAYYSKICELRWYHCSVCDRWDVHWNHEHFVKPKLVRYWHKSIK